jgi:hypothetical protein
MLVMTMISARVPIKTQTTMLITCLTLWIASTQAASISIDPSLPDGVYSAHPDPSAPNQHILQRHDNLNPIALEPRISPQGCVPNGCVDLGSADYSPWQRDLKEKLPLPSGGKRFCRDNKNNDNNNNNNSNSENKAILDPDDYYAAINLLFESPLFWMPPHTARFALHGGTIVYACAIGGWNSASLLEYMEAMAQLDAHCGESVPAKLTIPSWDKFYGREARGRDVCQWETEKGGMDGGDGGSELGAFVDQGCETGVNGIVRWLGLGDGNGGCNENAAGWEMWARLKDQFPWYKTPMEKGNRDTNLTQGGRAPS